VVLRNPDLAWRPGLFVTVSIGLDTTEAAVTVLSAAIQNIEGKDSIFVSTPSGFVVRPVKLGRRDGDHVEVLEGVTAGEEYVARNSFVLKAELGKDSAEHAH
jgi:cobalt-zinc-cadmium efflux system membrane fusion protein